MLTQEHAGTARAFLEEADSEFAEGDTLQASEKMWGAASHAIMAVAMQRGQDCGSHRKMVNFAYQIAEELNDGDLRAGIPAAQLLHSNFYHGSLEPDEVENPARLVRRFVERMLALAG